MTSALYFLILVRVILDFAGFYKPKPIWDVLYIVLFCIFGIVLLVGHKPDLQPTPEGWIFIGIGAIWGLVMYLRSVGLIAKPKTDTAPKDAPLQKPDDSAKQ